jgi:hypothetical protein
MMDPFEEEKNCVPFLPDSGAIFYLFIIYLIIYLFYYTIKVMLAVFVGDFLKKQSNYYLSINWYQSKQPIFQRK